MKKLGLLLVLIAIMVNIAITKTTKHINLKSDISYVDTIVAAETLEVYLRAWTRELSGAFRIQYYVRSIRGDVLVKWNIDESLDSLGWFNKTLIDSCEAADSALFRWRPDPASFYRNIWEGFGVDGDSSFIKVIIKPIVR